MNGLAVVIPALNAAATLPATLASLGPVGDLLVVDGGSADATVATARRAGARVIATGRGRGGQIAAGVAASRGDWLLLLHADTVLAPGWREAAAAFMGEPCNRARAGYFRLAYASPAGAARRLERLVAWRSALGLPYGDQGLLLARDFLQLLGGMRSLPLMEDVELVRRIGRRGLVPLAAVATTSAARYEAEGWMARPLRNLACLGLYFAGVPPHRLLRLYR